MSKIVAEMQFIYQKINSKAKEKLQRKHVRAKSKHAAETKEQKKKICQARNKKDRARRLAKMIEVSYLTDP